MKRNGSVLLSVLVMLGALGMLARGWWERASMNYDLIRERELYQKNFHITDRIFHIMMQQIKENFSDFLTGTMPIRVNTSFIAKKLAMHDTDVASYGEVTRVAQHDALGLMVTLLRKNSVVCTIRGRLVKKEQGYEEKSRFFIEYYTVGTGI